MILSSSLPRFHLLSWIPSPPPHLQSRVWILVPDPYINVPTVVSFAFQQWICEPCSQKLVLRMVVENSPFFHKPEAQIYSKRYILLFLLWSFLVIHFWCFEIFRRSSRKTMFSFYLSWWHVKTRSWMQHGFTGYPFRFAYILMILTFIWDIWRLNYLFVMYIYDSLCSATNCCLHVVSTFEINRIL